MHNWTTRERGLGIALVLALIAAIAVPAWADSDDSEDAIEPAPSPGPGDGVVIPAGEPGGEPVFPAPADRTERAELDGLGDCLRRHGAPLPEVRPEDPMAVPLPRGDDGGAFDRAAEACGMPEPPPGTDPFPLSDEQIAEQRRALERFAECMEAQGQEVGDPDVGRGRITIPLGPGAFSEDFLAAQRECGGPPLPAPSGPAP